MYKIKNVIAAGFVFLAMLGTVMCQMCAESKKVMSKAVNFREEIFGENVYIFSPEDSPQEVNGILEDIYEKQEANQFGKERYAVYFMPGIYDESIEVNVGFYTQVAGLGEMPTDTRIPSLNCTAEWEGDDPNNHNACCNFWRGVENIEIGSNTMWGVSQATFMRRTQIDGALYLHDNYGWCSGGFLADSNTELMTDSGSQQQWLSRNCNWKAWMGSNWNMVFVGTEEGKAPEGAWPYIPYTEVAETERIQEKPFLIYDEEEGYQVCVPAKREHAKGVSWQQENSAANRKIPLSEFYIAKPGEDSAQTMNAALQKGKHLLLTPGIYELEEAIIVDRADTVVLGMGLATLKSGNGNCCMKTADVSGLILAGILFDAGEKESENLLVVGEKTEEIQSTDTHKTESMQKKDAMPEENGITLSDLFFRVGGTAGGHPARTKCCVTINSSHVTGDNFWVWRADHGEQVGWNKNAADNGMIVNGDDVVMYALMVEHFEKYQTVWNGNNGRVYMYQSEIPYDVPEQNAWKSHDGKWDGYASFYVDEAVEQFESWGFGIYLYNRDTPVTLHTAMEVPDKNGVKVHNICTVMLNGYPGMEHIINDSGGSVFRIGERQIICEYENGIIK